MARTIDRLSARAAQTLTKPGLHADGAGLYLRVDAEGAKRWVYIYQWRGKRKEMGLGSAQDVGVKDARAARDAARKILQAGGDPIEERQRRLAAAAVEPAPPVTFGAFADDWFKARRPDWSSETTAQRWKNILEVHCRPIRGKPIAEIDTAAVLTVLQPIWTQLADLAPRARAGIEDVLDAAKVKGLREGENPARWKGHLKHLLSAPKKLSRGHHPAMPFEDMPAFMAELRAHTASSARLIEFTILTAARPSEAREVPWPEIDLDQALWTVAAARMKERREHRVPLSTPAVALLREMEGWTGDGLLVFPGAKPGRAMSLNTGDKLLKMMGRDAYTMHGFRSSFRDWAAERTNFASYVAEAALAHQVGDATERAYRRQDALAKRRKLMEAWARFLDTPAVTRRVIPFHGQG